MAAFLAVFGALFLAVVVSASGWSLWMSVSWIRTTIPVWIAAPFAGLGFLQLWGWYWLEVTDFGFASGFWLFVAGSAIAVSTVGYMNRTGLRSVVRPNSQQLAVLSIALIAFAVVSCFLLNGFFAGNLPSSASYANNDVSSYAMLSDHLIDHGFSSPGTVAGADQGGVSAVDASGVRIVLTAAAVIAGAETDRMTASTVLIFLILLAAASMWVAQLLLPSRRWTSVIVGVLVLAPSAGAYLVGNYFLSQIATMAGLVAMFGLLLVASRLERWRERVALSILGGLVCVPMYLSYPHMAVLSQGCLIFGMLLGDGLKGVWERTSRIGQVALLSNFLAVVVLAPHIPDLINRARVLSNVVAGWPLSMMNALDVVGLTNYPSRSSLVVDAPLVWWSPFIVLAVILVIAAFLARAKGVKYSFLPLTVSLAVFLMFRLVVRLKGSNSYAQWKLMTFFQPVIILVLAVALVFIADAVFTRKDRLRNMAGITALFVWFVVMIRISSGLFLGPWLRIPDGLSGLRALEETNLTTVNIELAPFWESSWAAYYLSDLEVHVVSPSYYPTIQAPDSWTIRRASDPSRLDAKPVSPPYVLECDFSVCLPIDLTVDVSR